MITNAQVREKPHPKWQCFKGADQNVETSANIANSNHKGRTK